MKKIPTLFEREFQNHKVVGITEKVTPGMEWVLEGKGIATEKIDGACCAIIDGSLYKRYDAKRGKKAPEILQQNEIAAGTVSPDSGGADEAGCLYGAADCGIVPVFFGTSAHQRRHLQCGRLVLHGVYRNKGRRFFTVHRRLL